MGLAGRGVAILLEPPISSIRIHIKLNINGCSSSEETVLMRGMSCVDLFVTLTEFFIFFSFLFCIWLQNQLYQHCLTSTHKSALHMHANMVALAWD